MLLHKVKVIFQSKHNICL